MKKFLSFVLSVCLTAAILAQAAVSAAQIGRVNTAVRFRTEPKDKASYSFTLYDGYQVKIISESDGWYKVEYNGKTGYIKTKYVSVAKGSKASGDKKQETSKPSAKQKPLSGAGRVKVAVRFRTEPKQDAKSSFTLYPGARVTVLSTTDGWCKVISGKATGYIKPDYLDIKADKTAAKPDPAQSAQSKLMSGIGKVQVAVRFRKEPKQDAKSDFTLYPYVEVTVHSTTDGWCKVDYKGTVGYIKPQYLEIRAAAASAEAPKAAGEPKLTSGIGRAKVAVRFRNEPKQDAKSEFPIFPGDEVKVESTADGWCKVLYNGKTGYIKAEYLDIRAAAAPSTPEAPKPPAAEDKDFRGSGTIKTAVRFRHEPKEDAKSSRTLYPGYRCLVLSKTGEWALCEYAGRRGYVKAEYIDLRKETIQSLTEPGTKTGTGKVNSKDVYLRLEPKMSSGVVRALDLNEEVDIYERSGEWCRVIANGDGGFVKIAQVTGAKRSAPQKAAPKAMSASVAAGPGYIDGSKVRLRSGPGTRYDILAVTSKNAAVSILGEEAGWTRVKYNGQEGYISSDYVKRGAAPQNTPVKVEGNGGNAGQKVVEFAKKYIGYKYVWAGSSPETGFDCSGFTSYVFRSLGYSTNRVAQDIFQNGTYVDYEDLQPGDAVFFGKSQSSINHVGIYIGNGEFIHADSYMGYVHIDELGDGDNYTKKFVGGRRIAG